MLHGYGGLLERHVGRLPLSAPLQRSSEHGVPAMKNGKPVKLLVNNTLLFYEKSISQYQSYIDNEYKHNHFYKWPDTIPYPNSCKRSTHIGEIGF